MTIDWQGISAIVSNLVAILRSAVGLSDGAAAREGKVNMRLPLLHPRPAYV